MADIKITDLRPAGAEFFADDENFMTELTEDELNVWGGSLISGVVVSSDVSDVEEVSIISKNEVSDVSDISITIGGQ